MKRIEFILTRYRYRTVAILSALMIFSAMWVVVDMTTWSRRYPPAVSSYLFFSTLFVWMWVVNRVGATEPIARSTKRYAILAIFPLVMIASIGFVTLILLPWEAIEMGFSVFATVYLLATATFVGMLLHRIVLTNKLRTKSRYVVIALLSLGLAILWCALLMALIVFPQVLGYPGGLIFVIVSLSIVFGSVVPAVYSTVLISTMRRSYRNRVAIVIGVLIAITLGGWAVMTMLHNPSRSPYVYGDIFWCEDSQVRRVTRINYHTWFSGTKYHSWWGIPISKPKCGPDW